MSFSNSITPRQRLAFLLVALLCVHAGFTWTIRGYVVPKLTPAVHWKYGLQANSDSHVFHTEAVRLVSAMREVGWNQVRGSIGEGMNYAVFIATVYYVTGTQTPYIVFVLDGLIYAANGLLLFALLYRSGGVQLNTAIASTFLLCLSPIFLFSHSELLREPFAVFGGLVFLIGLLEFRFERARSSPKFMSLVLWALASTAGFVIVTALRTYLMVPLLLPIAAMLILLIWQACAHPNRSTIVQTSALGALFGCLVVFYVGPGLGRVQQYRDESITLSSPDGGGNASAVSKTEMAPTGDTRFPTSQHEADAWKEKFIQSVGASRLDRSDLIVPHWCTVEWRRTSLLPRFIDAKFEALSCAREDFLRFCDQTLLGRHADRFCDEANLTNAWAVLGHLPQATSLGLLAPYPSMWLDDFGSGGTGLRRIGYVIDGVTDYILLMGLVGVCLAARHRPDLLIVTASLIAIIAVCALAIPSQFILARIRLAMYVPLLAFGIVGWTLLLEFATSRYWPHLLGEEKSTLRTRDTG